MKCNCCGREIINGGKRDVYVTIEHDWDGRDYFRSELLCNICYEEILITLGAYLNAID